MSGGTGGASPRVEADIKLSCLAILLARKRPHARRTLRERELPHPLAVAEGHQLRIVPRRCGAAGISDHYQRDVSRERLAQLGMIDTKNLLVRAPTCASCHVGSADQDMNHDMIAAGHPPLRFEQASYEALLGGQALGRSPAARCESELRGSALGGRADCGGGGGAGAIGESCQASGERRTMAGVCGVELFCMSSAAAIAGRPSGGASDGLSSRFGTVANLEYGLDNQGHCRETRGQQRIAAEPSRPGHRRVEESYVGDVRARRRRKSRRKLVSLVRRCKLQFVSIRGGRCWTCRGGPWMLARCCSLMRQPGTWAVGTKRSIV